MVPIRSLKLSNLGHAFGWVTIQELGVDAVATNAVNPRRGDGKTKYLKNTYHVAIITFVSYAARQSVRQHAP